MHATVCSIECLINKTFNSKSPKRARWGGADLKLGQRNRISPPRTKMSYNKRRCIQIGYGIPPILNTQSCNKGLLVVWNFSF